MDRRLRQASCALLVLLFGIATACARAPRTRTLSTAHAEAIRDSVQRTLDLFRHYSATRQFDSLAALYAEDARFRWVENGVVQYRSADQIRAALAALPPGVRIETAYEDTEIIPIAPGAASVVTKFQTRFVGPSAPPFQFGGAITMMLVHQREGWRILGGHTSSPLRESPR